MRHKITARLTIFILGTVLFLSVPLLSGCSGGGGGSTPPSAAVSGRLQSTAGGSVSGYRVVFNRGGSRSVSATTDAQGAFTLPVPPAAITGADTLSVLDPGGALVATAPVTLAPGSTSPVVLPPIAVGPPPPPGSV